MSARLNELQNDSGFNRQPRPKRSPDLKLVTPSHAWQGTHSPKAQLIEILMTPTWQDLKGAAVLGLVFGIGAVQTVNDQINQSAERIDSKLLQLSKEIKNEGLTTGEALQIIAASAIIGLGSINDRLKSGGG